MKARACPATRLVRRALDGVLLLDKPAGPSSNDALQRVRWLMAARKAGHGGTLDPLAHGLLPIAFGEATKFINRMIDADKGYVADIRLGERSSTGDAEGERSPVDPERALRLTRYDLETALAGLRGSISQRPPMHSALKHDGRPLYAYAREGREIAREERRVQVHELSLVSVALPDIRVRALVSKGTYIRVLAEDIGAALGTGAWMRALRRTTVGPFDVDRAIGLAELERLVGLGPDGAHPGAGDPHWHCPADDRLMPVDAMLDGLPLVRLSVEEARRFGRGQPVSAGRHPGVRSCRVYAPLGFIGLGREQDGLIHPVRLVAPERREHA